MQIYLCIRKFSSTSCDPMQRARAHAHTSEYSSTNRLMHPQVFRALAYPRTIPVSYIHGCDPPSLTRRCPPPKRSCFYFYFLFSSLGDSLENRIYSTHTPLRGGRNKVLAILVDKNRLPALVHCPDGRVLCGVVLWCLRRLQCWDDRASAAEFARFSGVLPPREVGGCLAVVF